MKSVSEDGQFSRRRALMTIGGIGLLVACSDSIDTSANALPTVNAGPDGAAAPSCAPTMAQDEGPYFVEEKLLRSDLTAATNNVNAKNGVPLRMRFTVYDVKGGKCTPLKGAHVDVWHADSQGLYSDECLQGTLGDKSLRGYQVTDAAGLVEFVTIFPGWYTGRTIHFHVKLRLYAGATQTLDFTTQLYAPDALTDVIMATPPYDKRGPRGTTNANDVLFNSGPGEGGSFRFPADVCAALAGDGGIGAALGGGAPTLGDGGGAAPSPNAAGPHLLMNFAKAAGGQGYVGEFTFGIVSG